MSRVGVDQDHQIIGKTCMLDAGVLAVTRGLLETTLMIYEQLSLERQSRDKSL